MKCSQLACCLHVAASSIASWIDMLGRWNTPVAVFPWSWRLSSSPFLHIDYMPSVLAEEEDTTNTQWTCLHVLVAVFPWSWMLSSSPFLHIDCMPSVLAEEEHTTNTQWTCLRVHGRFDGADLDSCLSWNEKTVRSRSRCPPPWGCLSRNTCYWLSG